MNIRTLFSRRYVLGAAAVVVVAGGAWFFFFRASDSYGATITVHPGDFAEQISVSGTVNSAQNVDLGFAQSGRVSGVYASVGDVVRAGALIAQTENGDLRAAIAQKQAALQAAQANLASSQAGTRPEQIAVTQSQVASDQTALVQANQAVVNAVQNAYTQSDDAVHNKVDQFFSNPRSITPTLGFSTSNSQLQSTLVNERSALEPVLTQWQSASAGLMASGNLANAETSAQQNLGLVAQLLSDSNTALNLAVPTTQNSQTTINGYITSVATARANVNTAQSSLTGAITSLQAAQAALDKDQKNLALQQAGSTANDIAAQQAQVAVAQADLQNAQAQLQKTIVTAPFDGTVTRMDAKVGEIVSPTTPQISMISSGLFQIETYVPEIEIAQLHVGDMATTTLDAYGSNTYFAAKVIAIDPGETDKNGVATYKTTLQFLGADARIRSGMTASVDITTQSISNAIAIPRGSVFQKSGQQVVQIVRNKTIVDTPVQTGGTSGIGNVQIVSGLQDGDVVVLTPNTSR